MFYRRYNDVLLGAGDVMSDLRKAQPPCQTGSQCIGGKCPECEREWVGLTDEEEAYVLKSIQKLEEKNT